MLVNYLWTHMMFIYRPSPACAPSSFLLYPSFVRWHPFFHTLQMEREWVRVWCGLIDGWREIGFIFSFDCLGFGGGLVARWSAPLPPSRFVGLIPSRGSRHGVCVFLKWPVSSTNREISSTGDSELPLGCLERVETPAPEAEVIDTVMASCPFSLFPQWFTPLLKVFITIMTIEKLLESSDLRQAGLFPTSGV